VASMSYSAAYRLPVAAETGFVRLGD